MYTYLLSYNMLYFGKEISKRRVLNFNREIESLDDVNLIQRNLQRKEGCTDIGLNSFSRLKKKEDDFLYSLDKDWE